MINYTRVEFCFTLGQKICYKMHFLMCHIRSPIKEWTPVDELNHIICYSILNCTQVPQVKTEKASFPIKENATQPNSDVHVLLGSS